MKEHSFKKRPCKYCKITHAKPYGKDIQDGKGLCESDAWIQYDSTNGNFEIIVGYDANYGHTSIFTNINYCPVCGRKLEFSA